MFGKKKNKDEVILVGDVLEGLPKAERNNVMFKLSIDKIQILVPTQKTEYNLQIEKVCSVQYFNEKEIEKIISQSAPGMIIGAATFGVLGAMVGGRVKTKEKKNINHFVLFTYVSASETKEILLKTNDFWGAGKFVDYFKLLKPELNQTKCIEL